MHIPEKLIRYAAVTPTVYKQGDLLRRAKAVSLQSLHNESAACRATAIVTDEQDGALECTVTLNETDNKVYFNGTCPCRENKRYTHFCKHLTALLLTLKHDKHLRAEAQFDMVDKLIQDIQQLPDNEAADLTLQPTLIVDRHGVFAEFTIGRDKRYIVRSLSAFEQAFRTRKPLAYSASLTITPSFLAFEPASRALVRLIVDTLRNQQLTSGNQRLLPLSPANIDAFFAAVEALDLPAKLYGTEVTLTHSTDAPPLRVSAKMQDGCAKLSLSHPDFRLFPGQAVAYVIIENHWYTVDLAYARTLSVLMPYFEQAAVLSIAERNLPRFAETVLPHLYHTKLLQCHGEGWEKWHPPTLCTRLYLDADSHGLQLTVAFAYNEQVFNPLTDTRHSVLRDRAREAECLQAIAAAGFRADAPCYRVYGDDPVYRFFTRHLDRLRQVADEIYIAEKAQRLTPRAVSAPHLSVSVDGGMLALDFQPDDEAIDYAAVLAAVRTGKRYHRLPDGAFLSLEDPALASMAALLDGLGQPQTSLPRQLKTQTRNAFFIDSYADALALSRSDDFTAKLNAFKDMGKAAPQPTVALTGTLRPYQQEGYHWLSALAQFGFGGILADEMGLGKTIQMIALLQQLAAQGPSLVIAPTSLIYNWQYELQAFAPRLNPILITGTPDTRRQLLVALQPGDIAITSYDTLKRDSAHYQPLHFACCVADEAQVIKNAQTQNAQAAKKINAAHRFALTGTPIENAPRELWSIFDFLMPGYLYNAATFTQRFEKPILKHSNPTATDTLRRLVSPFILRRMKRDVLTELPPKIETIEHAPLNPAQCRLYNAFLASARGDFMAETQQIGLEKMHIKLLAILTRLRQICCHPALFVDGYKDGSGKFDLFMQLMRDCRDGDHRVLVFSQFTKMLDIMQAKLTREGFALQRLDGSTPALERQSRVNAFNNGVGDIFLIALKAGGAGLNLTGADTVVHYDPWWNAAVQNQATDRSHRIGQTKPVQVLNLITNGSVEEKIMQLQAQKNALTDRLLQSDGLPFHQLDITDIAELLSDR